MLLGPKTITNKHSKGGGALAEVIRGSPLSALSRVFDEPVVYHWLERIIDENAKVSAMQDRSDVQEGPYLYN